MCCKILKIIPQLIFDQDMLLFAVGGGGGGEKLCVVADLKGGLTALLPHSCKRAEIPSPFF